MLIVVPVLIEEVISIRGKVNSNVSTQALMYFKKLHYVMVGINILHTIHTNT